MPRHRRFHIPGLVRKTRKGLLGKVSGHSAIKGAYRVGFLIWETCLPLLASFATSNQKPTQCKYVQIYKSDMIGQSFLASFRVPFGTGCILL